MNSPGMEPSDQGTKQERNARQLLPKLILWVALATVVGCILSGAIGVYSLDL